MTLVALVGTFALSACTPGDNQSGLKIDTPVVSPPAEEAPSGLMPNTAAINANGESSSYVTVFYPSDWQEVSAVDLGATVPQDNAVIASYVGPNGETLILEVVAPLASGVTEVANHIATDTLTRVGDHGLETSIRESSDDTGITVVSQYGDVSTHSKVYKFGATTVAVTLSTVQPSDITDKQLDYIVNSVSFD
jgi:hypothetical protein